MKRVESEMLVNKMPGADRNRPLTIPKPGNAAALLTRVRLDTPRRAVCATRRDLTQPALWPALIMPNPTHIKKLNGIPPWPVHSHSYGRNRCLSCLCDSYSGKKSTLLTGRRATVAEGRYIGPGCLGDDDLKVRRPQIERFFSLLDICAAIIDSGNTSLVTTNVI
jgi:hypothetical protein